MGIRRSCDTPNEEKDRLNDKETIGEENVEKIVEVAKDKATEVASGLKDKFQK